MHLVRHLELAENISIFNLKILPYWAGDTLSSSGRQRQGVFMNCRLFTFLALATCALAAVAEAPSTAPRPVAPEQIAAAQEQDDQALFIAIEQLIAQTEFLLQTVRAEARQHRSLPNHQEVTKYLDELLKTFSATKAATLQNPDLGKLIQLIEVCAAISERLETLVKSSFRDLSPLNMPAATRAQATPEALISKLEESLLASKGHADSISEELQYVGLDKFRRYLRKTSNFIKHHSPSSTYVWAGVGAAAVAAIILYRMDFDTDNNVGALTDPTATHHNKLKALTISAAKKIKHWVGAPAQYSYDTEGNKVTVREGKPGFVRTLDDGLKFVFGIHTHELYRYDILKATWKLFGVGPAAMLMYEKFKHRIDRTTSYLFGKKAEKSDFAVVKMVKAGFEEVVGNESAKNLLEPYIEYMTNPDKFKRADATPVGAIMITGDTRTGKTFLGEKAVGEMNQRRRAAGNFKEVAFVELKAGEVHAMQERFGSLGDCVRVLMTIHAPCVIFIDEIHLLNLHKDKDPKMLSEFLTMLSSLQNAPDGEPCLLIAATNRPELLDHALLQKGRFGTTIRLEYPNEIERAEFIVRKLRAAAINFDKEFLGQFVIKTQGLSFEQIDDIIKEQKRLALIWHTPVTVESLDLALNRAVYNIQENALPLTPNDELRVAVKIAAQLVAHHILEQEVHTNSLAAPHHRIITRATVMPILRKVTADKGKSDDWFAEQKTIKQYGGVFSYFEHEPTGIMSEVDIKREVMFLVAGAIGQEILFGSRTYLSDTPDLAMQEAFELCLKLAYRGKKPEQLSKKRLNECKEQAEVMLEDLEKEIKAKLVSEKDKIFALAHVLTEAKTLNEPMINELLTLINNEEFLPKILAAIKEKETASTASAASIPENAAAAVSA